MTVRRETSAWARGTGSVVCEGARPATGQTGTAARKKGANTNQYVDQLSGEPATEGSS